MTHRISWTLFLLRTCLAQIWEIVFGFVLVLKHRWYDITVYLSIAYKPYRLTADSSLDTNMFTILGIQWSIRNSSLQNRLSPARNGQVTLSQKLQKCHQPATARIFWSGVAESVTWYFRPCTNVHIYSIHLHVLHTYLEAWNIDPK